MKNKEEYLASIYAKRDKELIKRKKKISAITAAACLAVCFTAIFAFVPKQLKHKASNPIETQFYGTYESVTDFNDKQFTMAEEYSSPVLNIYNNNAEIGVDGVLRETVKSTSVNKAESEKEQETYIETATEIPQKNFGASFGGLSFLNPFEGSNAISPENPHEDYVTGTTEPYQETPDSEDDKTTESKTKAKLRSSDDAITEALKYLPEEDAEKIKDDETHVTISRTASGKSTYTVYFYTETKTFSIELNAVTLEMIECKEKNKITGNVNYYSPAHFPETTAALPEYIP